MSRASSWTGLILVFGDVLHLTRHAGTILMHTQHDFMASWWVRRKTCAEVYPPQTPSWLVIV
jgi:hypothetical protein